MSKTPEEKADQVIQSYDAQREAAEYEPKTLLGQQRTFQAHLAGQRYGYVKGYEAGYAEGYEVARRRRKEDEKNT